MVAVNIESYPHVRKIEENVSLNNADVDIVPVVLSDAEGSEQMIGPVTALSGELWPALVPDLLISARLDQMRYESVVDTGVRRSDTLEGDSTLVPTVVKTDAEGATYKVLSDFSEMVPFMLRDSLLNV